MDTDDGGHTIVDISTEPQLTPKMPTAPYFQRQKSSPRSQLNREIFEVKRSITQTEREIDKLDAEINTLETQKRDFMARADKEPSFWQLVGDYTRLIQTLSERGVEKDKRIIRDKDRLSWLEKRLERAEEAAAERAKASIKNATKSFLSTEGPDIANIIDIRKFETMKAWLDDENVLLLRSPPGSGKTTFALSFAAHLHSKGFKATYLNASLAQSTMNDTKSMDNVWQGAFESDSTFSDICTTPSEEDHYIIIDEAQSWYPSNVKDWRARQQLNHFWADVKFFVKPALELANYVQNALSHSTTQNNPSSPTGRVRLLCLAGYGEANVGSIATPLVFVDPLDSTKNLRLPLGLEFLRLDLEMTHALIAKIVEIKESEGKKMTFGTDVRELIYQETNGHVGAVRTLLFHFSSTDKTSKQDVIDFTQREVYQTDLSAYRSFLSVSETTIRKLRPEDLSMLIQCIAKYKQGHRGFLVEESRVAELVKLGMFVKTTATAIGGCTTIAFPSPLHYDLALYNVLHRTVELQPTAECFEQVLKEFYG